MYNLLIFGDRWSVNGAIKSCKHPNPKRHLPSHFYNTCNDRRNVFSASRACRQSRKVCIYQIHINYIVTHAGINVDVSTPVFCAPRNGKRSSHRQNEKYFARSHWFPICSVGFIVAYSFSHSFNQSLPSPFCTSVAKSSCGSIHRNCIRGINANFFIWPSSNDL